MKFLEAIPYYETQFALLHPVLMGQIT